MKKTPSSEGMFRHPERGRCALTSGFALLALCAAPISAIHAEIVLDIQPAPVSREQALAEIVELKEGTDYLIEATQLDVDVSVSLIDPAGQIYQSYNSPLTDQGWEVLLLTPKQSGNFEIRLDVVDESNVSGSIALSVTSLKLTDVQRSAFQRITQAAKDGFDTEDRRIRAIAAYAEAADSLAKEEFPREHAHFRHAIARLHELSERPSEAVRSYEMAAESYRFVEASELALWMQYRQASMETYRDRYSASRALLEQILITAKEIGSERIASAATNYIGVNHFYEGNFDLAEQWILDSLTILKKANLTHQLATTVYNLGWIKMQEGDALLAREYFQEALNTETELGDIDEQIDTHVSISTTYRNMGDCGGAIAELDRARQKIEARNNNRQLARIMSRSATCYSILGDYKAANKLLSRAKELAERTEDRREVSYTLTQIGDNHRILGFGRQALESHTAAITLQSEIGDKEGAAENLINAARDLTDLGNLDSAREQLVVAKKLLAETSSRTLDAEHALALGTLHRHSGEPEAANRLLQDAAKEFALLLNPVGQSDALTELGKLHLPTDRSMAARYLDEAIALGELRSNRIARPELRARMASTLSEAVFLRAELDIARYLETGSTKFAEASFLSFNRARSSALFDGRAQYLISEGATASDRSHRKEIRGRITAKLVALQELLESESPAQNLVSSIEADVELLHLELDGLEQTARGDRRNVPNSNYSEKDLAGLQKILGPNAAILQYALGETSSYAFLVTSSDIDVLHINSPETITENVNRLHEVISRRGAYRSIAARLSESLLSILTADSVPKRLHIVPDGALHYLPFAALPAPGSADPLIDVSEISTLPNPFLLSARNTDSKIERIAILADAVFSLKDERLTENNASEIQTDGSYSWMRDSFPRLPYTAVEADAIADQAGLIKVDLATGFDVNKERLLRQLAARPDVLHIATHGVAHLEYAELSGLALSAVDKSRNATGDFLSLPEIYELESSPHLVVLSACETAIGEYIRGEGLISLSRAFVQRGANDVIGTIWRVPDESTAELMGNLYGELVGKGKTPVAALRWAQRQLRATHKWRHPYYWAGFAAASVY